MAEQPYIEHPSHAEFSLLNRALLRLNTRSASVEKAPEGAGRTQKIARKIGALALTPTGLVASAMSIYSAIKFGTHLSPDMFDHFNFGGSGHGAHQVTPEVVINKSNSQLVDSSSLNPHHTPKHITNFPVGEGEGSTDLLKRDLGPGHEAEVKEMVFGKDPHAVEIRGDFYKNGDATPVDYNGSQVPSLEHSGKPLNPETFEDVQKYNESWVKEHPHSGEGHAGPARAHTPGELHFAKIRPGQAPEDYFRESGMSKKEIDKVLYGSDPQDVELRARLVKAGALYPIGDADDNNFGLKHTGPLDSKPGDPAAQLLNKEHHDFDNTNSGNSIASPTESRITIHGKDGNIDLQMPQLATASVHGNTIHVQITEGGYGFDIALGDHPIQSGKLSDHARLVINNALGPYNLRADITSTSYGDVKITVITDTAIFTPDGQTPLHAIGSSVMDGAGAGNHTSGTVEAVVKTVAGGAAAVALAGLVYAGNKQLKKSSVRRPKERPAAGNLGPKKRAADRVLSPFKRKGAVGERSRQKKVRQEAKRLKRAVSEFESFVGGPREDQTILKKVVNGKVTDDSYRYSPESSRTGLNEYIFIRVQEDGLKSGPRITLTKEELTSRIAIGTMRLSSVS